MGYTTMKKSGTGLLALAAGIGGVFLASSVYAGTLQQETHTFVHHVVGPDVGGHYEETIIGQLPQFDTQGGTRQLLGVYENYVMELVGSGSYSDELNTTQNSIGGQVRYATHWRCEIFDQGIFFPYHSDFAWTGTVELLGAKGAWTVPLTSLGGTFEIARDTTPDHEGAVPLERLNFDPVLLNALTGTGTFDVLGIAVVDPITSEPLPPGAPVTITYVPWFATIDQWEFYRATFEIRYAYTTTAPACPADLDNNSTVNVFDLLELLLAWGQSDVPADIDDSGTVNVFDLLELLLAWGPC